MAGEPPVASYVRIRREFSVQALFASVQYSFSNDGQTMIETLVLHVRDPKDLIQVSLEDSASSVTSAEAMLSVNTPASRVRLERFGKVLGRARPLHGGGRPSGARSERLRTTVSRRVGCAGELSQAVGRRCDCSRGAGENQRNIEAEGRS